MTVHIAPIIATVVFFGLIIVELIVFTSLKQARKTQYADVARPTLAIALVAMWIMYMGAWLSQLNPLIVPDYETAE